MYLNFAASSCPGRNTSSSGLELIRRSATAAEETGNISYACYARTCLITLLLAQGDPLAEAQREVEEALAFTKRARFELVADAITTDRQLIRMLRGLLPRFGSLTDAELDEETFEAHLARAPPGDHRLLVLDPKAAGALPRPTTSPPPSRPPRRRRRCSGRRPSSSRPPSTTSTPRWRTPRATTRWRPRSARGTGRPSSRTPASSREWARHCPENFRSRAALADAEIARIEGRVADAERLYEEALTSARESGFVHDEAIAYETAARFWRARGYPLFGDAYLQEACARYRRWGAEGKVQQLSRLHPHLGQQLAAAPISLAELPATSPISWTSWR